MSPHKQNAVSMKWFSAIYKLLSISVFLIQKFHLIFFLFCLRCYHKIVVSKKIDSLQVQAFQK